VNYKILISVMIFKILCWCPFADIIVTICLNTDVAAT
jgi:hypothetical protein